ncbi:MAG TPA: phosphate signaling complex protein PhoU [Candidatus Limnocylindria bacterium]|jgi:phosphate transport system protein|nr:phosphate signaling complex protein PhoU [Candidatus Limnocylindria bacterium]
MRTAYHQALENTRLDVVRLGALVSDAIRSATNALEKRDAVLAGRVIAGDDEIDDMRRRVEAACIQLIWKQQPVAGELREIAGMLQIVTDLERIGDYAVDIAKNSIKIADVPVRPASIEVGLIANLAHQMLEDVMRAFRERDAALADKVIERDDEVDILYRNGLEALQAEMQHDSGTVPAGTLLLFVISIIERVGDRAQNIAWHTKDMLP